jgi:hypothetical protein
MAILVVTALLASGCGGDDSSDASAGDITVESGSLSQEEFVRKADAVCATVRNRFTSEYEAFAQKEQPQNSKATQDEFLEETIEKFVIPNYEGEMIEQISALGPPSSEVEEVELFLNALQSRLDEFREQPSELTKTAFPFVKVAGLARDAGLNVCASSFG